MRDKCGRGNTVVCRPSKPHGPKQTNARAVGHRYDVQGLVIDPYNELHHARYYVSETEYVSQMLSKIKRFAQVSGLAEFVLLKKGGALAFSMNLHLAFRQSLH